MGKQPRLLSVIDLIALVSVAVATYMVFLYAPIEAIMGPVQKIFYFHVATAWVGMLGFMAAMGTAVAYLITKKKIWDLIEVSAIEIALVFFLITIVTGSIWAYPAWNTWWTWDPRLTTASIVELVYLAYMMLRQGIEDPERRARFGAVYAIVGSISVPVTFFAIRLMRTIHPVVIGANSAGAEGTFAMTPKMGLTFAISLIAFSILFISLLWHRIRLGALSEKVEELKLRLTQ
jgi:heme exporter protein C